MLSAYMEYPHQRIERHPQIANGIDLPVQCLFIRANDGVHRPAAAARHLQAQSRLSRALVTSATWCLSWMWSLVEWVKLITRQWAQFVLLIPSML